MADRPIIFSGPMVRAILAGKKTQTRRVVKPQPISGDWHFDEIHCALLRHDAEGIIRCPFGRPGDRLWVREWFSTCYDGPEAYQIIYSSGERRNFSTGAGATDQQLDWLEHSMDTHGERGRPGIHMPRWASRITLEITAVRVERLNEISEEDAVAEGCPGWYSPQHPDHGCTDGRTPSQHFSELWQDIHGPDSWAANPWVWVLEFRRIANG